MEKSLIRLRAGSVQHDSGGWSLSVPELEIRAGEVVMLDGANMSGKSTFLRLLSGQQEACPNASASTEKGGHVLLSAVDDPMFREWTVRDNVMVVPSSRTIEARVRDLESFLTALNQRLGWRISSADYLVACSTGARAFVQLARAFVALPKVYLVDELMSSLDDEKSGAFIESLSGLIAMGVAIVLVSHSDRDRQQIASAWSGVRRFSIKRLSEERYQVCPGDMHC